MKSGFITIQISSWHPLPLLHTHPPHGLSHHLGLVFDELNGSLLPASTLRQVLDPLSRRLRVEYKGGMAMMTSNYIYITSNTHPGQWYHCRNEGEELAIWGRLPLIRVYYAYKQYTEFKWPADMTPDVRARWMRDQVVQCWNEHHLGGDGPAPNPRGPQPGNFEAQ